MTTKNIGPSFGDEIEDAGLTGLPVAWGEDGIITGTENLSVAERKKLEMLLEKHDPSKPSRRRTTAQMLEMLLAEKEKQK